MLFLTILFISLPNVASLGTAPVLSGTVPDTERQILSSFIYLEPLDMTPWYFRQAYEYQSPMIRYASKLNYSLSAAGC